MKNCPFCHVPPADILAEAPGGYAIRDRFPVTSLHCLIIPRRHITSFQDMTPGEWSSVHHLARTLGELLQKEDAAITGFNLGINDGAVAGQTMDHAHVHWIPRRAGDVPECEGGVRWIFPGKATYTARSGGDTSSPSS